MTVLDARYELGRRIGAGGMAEVVSGYDRKLERPVAVKLLRGGLEDARARDRFVREAQHAAGFSHPNVVAVYDVGETEGRPYLVMELVDGRTLQQLLASRGPLPVDHALRIADALLAALSAAHSRGLVHRDVKPGNVLLGRDGSVKLADFGIAKALRDDMLALTATGQMMGTPSYLAPEVVDGLEATPQADLYAVGVVLYEMLTGAPPFTGDHPVAVAVAHRAEPIPDLDLERPGLPAGISAVVARALEKDPARRFASSEAMRTALRTLDPGRDGEATVSIAASTTRSMPVAVEHTTTAPRRTRRWPALLLALLILALVAAVALVLSTDGDPGGEADGGGRRAAPVTVASTTPPTQPPTTATTTLPRTLDALVALLGASPESFGERGPDLLDELLDLRERPSPGQVRKLQRDVARWIERGELGPEIGNFALEVLGAGAGFTLPTEEDGSSDDFGFGGD